MTEHRLRAPDAEPDADPLAFPLFTHPRRVRAELVSGILRSGRVVPDETFDEIYPEPVRRASSHHWTPIRVCARIVELLGLRPEDRLLDIGSGAGKVCIVASAMTGARVRGVEREPRLAEVAREAARRLQVDLEIVGGDFADVDPDGVDVAYLFNPFRETLLLPGAGVPESGRRSSRALEDITAAEQFFEKARPGTRVVTFWGFGGAMPQAYERVAREVWDGGALEIWVKRSP